LSRCGNLNLNFNLAYFNRLNVKEDPQIVKLFARSAHLTNVELASNNLNKNFAEALSLALDPRRANFTSQIKVLNLSKNNLCKDGIKLLADVFHYNQIIEILDLSKN
jgi:Ran GTPase-activating protein (RanGAP) involved in mRNA processing and transport